MSIKDKIESLLFIAAKPLTVKQLAELIKVEEGEIKKAGDELETEYKNNRRGIQLIKDSNKYQMVSSPDSAKLVQEFIKDETTGELSRPSLETLTIIAYRGPIAKTDLDRIRGVNCSLILHNLLLRNLVEAKSDKKGATYYNVTFDFIRFLGINNISELPDYQRLNKLDTIDKVLAAQDNSLVDSQLAISEEENN
ncbi:MAG: SMC-Scp complex subunit ScpB [Candidatus Falkowbacteria bacterium]|nr:SMC-Scp complex subunit ScpB [Candidatus Falkowbacteria bacterium]